MLRNGETASKTASKTVSNVVSDGLEPIVQAYGVEGESSPTGRGPSRLGASGIEETKAGAWGFSPESENRVECVFIRDSARLTILQNIDDWTVQKLLGGLTDEPSSYEQLLASVAVFGSPTPLLPCYREPIHWNNLEAAQALTSRLDSWVWIDLAARMVVQWLPVFQPGLYQSCFGSMNYRPASPGATIPGPVVIGPNILGATVFGMPVLGMPVLGIPDPESPNLKLPKSELKDVPRSTAAEPAVSEPAVSEPAVSEVVYTLLPPDWRLDSISNCPNWIEVLARRVKGNQEECKVDAQAVLWGERFWEQWIESVWQYREQIGEEEWRFHCECNSEFLYERLVGTYLNQQRADLGGESPLHILRSSRPFVDQACQYRREMWVHLGYPPQAKGLTENRHGRKRFGTVQNRIILELLEYTLDRIKATSAAQNQVAQNQATQNQATLCEGLKTCLQSIVAWKNEFLQAFPEQSVWSRQERIELEQAFLPIPRQRVPWKAWPRALSPNSAIRAEKDRQVNEERRGLDSELPHTPMFEEILGFVDYGRLAPEVWQPKQSTAKAARAESLGNSQQERDELEVYRETIKRIGNEVNTVSAFQGEVEDFTTVWKHSYLNWDAEWPVEACYSFLAMRLSFLVSEILMELHRAGDREHGEELIQRFSYVQTAAESEHGPEFEWAAGVFCDLLEELTARHPDLVPRLADLQSRLWEQIRKLNERKDV